MVTQFLIAEEAPCSPFIPNRRSPDSACSQLWGSLSFGSAHSPKERRDRMTAPVAPTHGMARWRGGFRKNIKEPISALPAALTMPVTAAPEPTRTHVTGSSSRIWFARASIRLIRAAAKPGRGECTWLHAWPEKRALCGPSIKSLRFLQLASTSNFRKNTGQLQKKTQPQRPHTSLSRNLCDEVWGRVRGNCSGAEPVSTDYFTEIFRGFADSDLGSVIVRTPSLNSAAASSSLTAQGSGRLRLKLPKRRSIR